MITAVRQTVTVKTDGHLEIDAPELRAGSVTEVIVLVPAEAPPAMTPVERVAAWNRLRAQINLSDEQAEQWKRDVRAERDAWEIPGGGSPR